MTAALLNYAIRQHGINSTLICKLADVKGEHITALLNGGKLRKNYSMQIEAALCKYLILMTDTSEELRGILEE